MSITLVTDSPRPVAMAISEQQVNEAVKSVEYHLFRNTRHMVCCVTLVNGYTVAGESACADPSKFSLELGQKYALEDAKSNIARLLAYGEAEKMMFGGPYEH
jgi:hypothetical protein